MFDEFSRGLADGDMVLPRVFEGSSLVRLEDNGSLRFARQTGSATMSLGEKALNIAL